MHLSDQATIFDVIVIAVLAAAIVGGLIGLQIQRLAYNYTNTAVESLEELIDKKKP